MGELATVVFPRFRQLLMWREPVDTSYLINKPFPVAIKLSYSIVKRLKADVILYVFGKLLQIMITAR